MPTYEYYCEKCKKEFDLFQSMKDEPIKTCPKAACRQKTWGKGKVRRQLGTGAGLIFKGSGFYITDYRSEGYKSAAKKDAGGGEAAAAGGESSKIETKPAAPATPAAPAKPAADKKPKSTGKKD